MLLARLSFLPMTHPRWCRGICSVRLFLEPIPHTVQYGLTNLSLVVNKLHALYAIRHTLYATRYTLFIFSSGGC